MPLLRFRFYGFASDYATMMLTHYNVEIAIVDPDDPANRAEYTLERYERELLMRMELLGTLVRTFEQEETDPSQENDLSSLPTEGADR